MYGYSSFHFQNKNPENCPLPWALPELSLGPAAARAPAAESLRAGSARGAAAQRHGRGAAEPTLGRTPGAPGGGVEDAEGVQKCRGTLANKLSTFVYLMIVYGEFFFLNVCIYIIR